MISHSKPDPFEEMMRKKFPGLKGKPTVKIGNIYKGLVNMALRGDCTLIDPETGEILLENVT